MSLRDWQKSLKPMNNFILQGTPIDGSSSWQPWTIGMCFGYCRLSKETKEKIQIGNHEKNVLCAMDLTSDTKRRGNQKINRNIIMKNLIKNKFTNEKLSHEQYFNSLRNYKFIISPEGNGIDCHRHYEALMSGCIPICEFNSKIEEKYSDLPILYTKDYSEITEEYLNKKYLEMIDKEYNFEKLFLSYYTNQQQEQIKFNGNYWTMKWNSKPCYQ